jgi:hypothetical protein
MREAEGIRAGVEEWEEPLHSGPLAALYPTFLHTATPIAHESPHKRHFDPRFPADLAWTSGVARWEAVGREGIPRWQAAVHPFTMHRALQSVGAFRPMDAH